MTAPVRVVKVGGSLLGWKDLPAALTKWLAQQSSATHVLIAGGGEFAEAIRRADATHGLGEEVAHWLCVDVLSVTARLLGAIVNVHVVTHAHELPSLAPAVCVFDPSPFLRNVEPLQLSESLPHTWAVTSDSIAARVAESLRASELVLLKSCLPGADAGYVDDYFPVAATKLPHIRCVNLRSRDFEEIIWDRRS
jgi:5-(aminomethyl)-3-furanmethanol phosphate kinase